MHFIPTTGKRIKRYRLIMLFTAVPSLSRAVMQTVVSNQTYATPSVSHISMSTFWSLITLSKVDSPTVWFDRVSDEQQAGLLSVCLTHSGYVSSTWVHYLLWYHNSTAQPVLNSSYNWGKSSKLYLSIGVGNVTAQGFRLTAEHSIFTSRSFCLSASLSAIRFLLSSSSFRASLVSVRSLSSFRILRIFLRCLRSSPSGSSSSSPLCENEH